MKKNDIYEMVDAQCTKKGENILTVDFSFDVMTNVKQAVSQIDKLVSLADDNDTIKFTDHRPSIFSKSEYSDYEDE